MLILCEASCRKSMKSRLTLMFRGLISIHRCRVLQKKISVAYEEYFRYVVMHRAPTKQIQFYCAQGSKMRMGVYHV